jgi:polysaccharide export outer membrane protein
MMKLRPFATRFAVAALFLLRVAGAPAADAVTAVESRHLSELGAGDAVSIQIFGQPEVTSVYVGDDGMISVPLAGPVRVGGLSPVDASARVAKALKDGGYFVDPHVTVLVTQSSSQLISVLGEVRNAGRYPITPRTTVLDLLAQAGGATDAASDMVYVLRADAAGHMNRYTVDLKGLQHSKDELPSQTLQGGDSLVVPRAEHFYVYGEVTTPGMYRVEPGMTVIQAIARAGGVTPRGSERRIFLKRPIKDGQYESIRPKPGDQVAPDDIIRVKESIF